MYEGYAPGGVAVLIECLTDNRNRAAAEVRTALTRNGGQLADPGCVSYLFTRKGVVIVPKGALTEDDLLEVVLDAGAEEVNDLGESFEIISEATDFVAVRTALQDAGIDYDSAEVSFVPTMQVELDVDGARKMFRVIDALEDSDDVQNVYANVDVDDEVLAELDEDERVARTPTGAGGCRRTGQHRSTPPAWPDAGPPGRCVAWEPNTCSDSRAGTTTKRGGRRCACSVSTPG